MKGVHSPGPWTWRYFGETLQYPQVADGQGDEVITFMPRSQKGVEMVDADARLIAAAPELLAALKALLDCAGWCGGHSGQRAEQCERCRAEDLIERVEGET